MAGIGGPRILLLTGADAKQSVLSFCCLFTILFMTRLNFHFSPVPLIPLLHSQNPTVPRTGTKIHCKLKHLHGGEHILC